LRTNKNTDRALGERAAFLNIKRLQLSLLNKMSSTKCLYLINVYI